jgi:hypothetical protein
MNYRQLRDKLNVLTEKQLDCNIRILTVDEYACDDEDRYNYDEEFMFVADTLQPYFQ